MSPSTVFAQRGAATAKLLVEGTFLIRGRNLFVAHGQVVDGAIRLGQRVTNPAGLDAPVHSVVFILPSPGGGRENPGAAFRHRDDVELARWQALVRPGMMLELVDDAPLTAHAPFTPKLTA